MRARVRQYSLCQGVGRLPQVPTLVVVVLQVPVPVPSSEYRVSVYEPVVPVAPLTEQPYTCLPASGQISGAVSANVHVG